jgi:hypothetical protein
MEFELEPKFVDVAVKRFLARMAGMHQRRLFFVERASQRLNV